MLFSTSLNLGKARNDLRWDQNADQVLEPTKMTVGESLYYISSDYYSDFLLFPGTESHSSHCYTSSDHIDFLVYLGNR